MSQSRWIGKTLGDRYEIEGLLGQGGMAAVYKARDPNLKIVVAIKIIYSHLSNNPNFVRRFEEEAAAVASMRHPNIIRVFDFNNDDDTYFIVFEFIPGESLEANLQRLNAAGRQMALSNIAGIATGLTDALNYAHTRGVIHRDIKPANAMLNVHGQAILMDFGLVKIIGGDSHTATGAVMGTALYMSPEQIKGEKVDARTDIYSLGVLLFEMAATQPPFQADSALTLMMMHVNDPVPDLKKIRSDVPPAFVAIINKALAKDRADRYQSTEELAADLKAVDWDTQAAAKAAAVIGGQAISEIKPEETVLDSAPVSPTSPTPEAPVWTPTVADASPVVPAPVVIPAAQPLETSVQQPATVAPESSSQFGGRRALVLGGIGVGLLLILCIAAAAIIFGTGLLTGGDEGQDAESTALAASVPDVEATESEQGIVEPTQEPLADETLPANTAEPLPSATPESLPTNTTAPLPTNTTAPLPTNTSAPLPTATAIPPTQAPPPTAAAGPRVQINNIRLDGQSYVVDYVPSGYTPALPGTHIHFFFNTIPPESAGAGPTQQTWFLYGGPNPFTGYSVGERPAAATQMCSLVANPDHTIQLNTGNCFALP